MEIFISITILLLDNCACVCVWCGQILFCKWNISCFVCRLNRAWNNRRGWQYSPVNAVKEKRPIHTESLKKLIFMCHLTNNFSVWVERLLWRSTTLDKSLATLNSYLLNQEGNCTASKNLGLIRDISRGLLCAPIFMKLNDNGLIVVLFETRSHVDWMEVTWFYF